MDDIVEISAQAKGILALINGAKELEKEMDSVNSRITCLEGIYTNLCNKRNALYDAARQLHHHGV